MTAEADTSGVPPGWVVEMFRLLSRLGNAPEGPP